MSFSLPLSQFLGRGVPLAGGWQLRNWLGPTPSGLIIEHNYSTVRVLVTSILGKRTSISLKELNKLQIDLRKKNIAIVPNVVHSFDASNIALLVKGITEEFNDRKFNLLTAPRSAIHDCFATNANDVYFMVYHVKTAFLSLRPQQRRQRNHSLKNASHTTLF